MRHVNQIKSVPSPKTPKPQNPMKKVFSDFRNKNMVLTESDLVRSLLAQPLYFSSAMQEIVPDDTNDMMVNYGRKGKSTEKALNKI